MDAVTLEQLQNPASAYYSEAKAGFGGKNGGIRLNAVRDAAVGVGLRGGMKARSDEINDALKQVDRAMDVTYDFRPYVVQDRVLPPVIVESRDVYTQSGDSVLRLAGRSYRIESQARFVSRVPTWREYLVMKYEITMPSPALLPKTPEETEVWRRSVAEGWREGIEQADKVFDMNYDRLHRDYLGILRFHRLVASNMVTMPIIAQSSTPVSGDGNQMAVDEHLLRITLLPSFNLNSDNWTATPGPVKQSRP